MKQIDSLFNILLEHETKLNESFSFIPSENILSPVARLAFLSDGFSRYFFDEINVSGRWSFPGGSIVGRIQTEILVPLLRVVGGAEYINVHGISGLSAMTVALAAFGGKPGNSIMSVSKTHGGHPDTAYVARKFGYVVHDIPFSTWDVVDLEVLCEMVQRVRPSLIYLDHATALYPLDLSTLFRTIRDSAITPVHIHMDTSHVNGLIWGGQLPNPLLAGADSYGGSTHKSFPGPHKAVLFTNNHDVNERLTLTAVNMISHHHLASVVALAITILEFVECDGSKYAAQILCNAKAFANALANRGMPVQGHKPVYTRNHQVWFAAPDGQTAHDVSDALFEVGLIVNPYNPLPSLNGLGIRTGVNEPTRLGLKEEEMTILANLMCDIIEKRRSRAEVKVAVAELRRSARVSYCYEAERFQELLMNLIRPFVSLNKSFPEALSQALYA
jgi:glycine hydroxymethyltransferase